MTEKTENRKPSPLRTADIAYIAICAAIIAVLSWISVPAMVPFTLQTFAVFCTLGLIGGKRGTIAVLVYILMGAIGLPVFAGFRGGIGALLGSTGGYILGFVLIGLLYWLTETVTDGRLPFRIGAMLVGLLLCYAFGTAWFMVVYARQSGPVGLTAALSWCVFPFIIPDLLKLALAVLVSEKLRRVIKI